MDHEKRNVDSAVDNAHPEKISELLRDKHMSMTEEEQAKQDSKKT